MIETFAVSETNCVDIEHGHIYAHIISRNVNSRSEVGYFPHPFWFFRTTQTARPMPIPCSGTVSAAPWRIGSHRRRGRAPGRREVNFSLWRSGLGRKAAILGRSKIMATTVCTRRDDFLVFFWFWEGLVATTNLVIFPTPPKLDFGVLSDPEPWFIREMYH